MATWIRKIDKALKRNGCTITRAHGHITITRMIDKAVVCDFITAGMDKQTLLRNLEILYLAVTQ